MRSTLFRYAIWTGPGRPRTNNSPWISGHRGQILTRQIFYFSRSGGAPEHRFEPRSLRQPDELNSSRTRKRRMPVTYEVKDTERVMLGST